MIIDMGYWTRVLKNIVILVLSLVFIFLSLKLAVFYMPFLIGFIISLLIEPLIKKLVKKTNLTRKTCAIISLLLIFSILIGLLAGGIISLITESSNLLQGLNNYIEKIYGQLQVILDNIQDSKVPTQVLSVIQNSSSNLISLITEYVSKFLTSILQGITSLPVVGIYIAITVLSTYFICTDKLYILDQMEHHFPRLWVKKFGNHLRKIITALGNYLKAQATLILISFTIVLIGLYIFKFMNFGVQYPLLAALAIGFVDALPILGSGTVMVPWAIIAATNGNITLGIGLIVLLAIIITTRQLLEPKIVSNKIGVHPIFTLIAMYTGFKAIGILGMFVGPIILIILKNIFSTMIDDGIVKSIFSRG